jgi:hypothetical protein
MKLLTLIAAAMLVSTTAMAQANHVRGILGFSSGEMNIGADYESRKGNVGVGGYFLFSGDDEDTGKNEIMALGAMAAVHLIDNSPVDIYIAPGFGIAMIEEPGPGGDDETTFGPIMKVGVEYAINEKAYLGLQHMFVYNWMSDDVSDSASFLNVAATFLF